jgi:hypothetical protein
MHEDLLNLVVGEFQVLGLDTLLQGQALDQVLSSEALRLAQHILQGSHFTGEAALLLEQLVGPEGAALVQQEIATQQVAPRKEAALLLLNLALKREKYRNKRQKYQNRRQKFRQQRK